MNEFVFTIAVKIRGMLEYNQTQATPELSMSNKGMTFEDGYKQALIDVQEALGCVLDEQGHLGLSAILKTIVTKGWG